MTPQPYVLFPSVDTTPYQLPVVQYMCQTCVLCDKVYRPIGPISYNQDVAALQKVQRRQPLMNLMFVKGCEGALPPCLPDMFPKRLGVDSSSGLNFIA